MTKKTAYEKKIETFTKDLSKEEKRTYDVAQGTVSHVYYSKLSSMFIDGNDRIRLFMDKNGLFHYKTHGIDEIISEELFCRLRTIYWNQSYTCPKAKASTFVSSSTPIGCDDDSIIVEDIIADDSCIESAIVTKETEMDIDELTRRLKAKLSTSDFRIWTYTYEGLSIREIEQKTGIPNSTVSYRLKKIRSIAKDIARDMGLI